jgi:hypothetical protein
VPATPASLEAALAGRPVDRPLVAPLFAALAARVEEVDVREFLSDAGRRARLLGDLARSLRPDVLVVDTGGSDPAVVVDVLTRLRAVVPEGMALGACVPGGGSALAAARTVAEAGASVVFVREDASVAVDPAEYARATAPLWGSLRFFRALGVLHLGAQVADGWSEVACSPGAFVPAVPPSLVERVAASGRPFGVALPPGAPIPPGAVLVTNDDDLLGRVEVRDLAGEVARMRA